MDVLFIYLGTILLLFCIVWLIYAVIHNKLEETIIRLNEAEANIDNNLRNKYDLINRLIAITKGNIKSDDELFEEIVKLRSRKISNFDLDRKLVEAYHEFIILKKQHKVLTESEEIKKIEKNIEDIDKKLIILKQYYNDFISKYNILINKFPTNIVALLKKLKEKTFFDKKDMTDDDENDFKL